MRRTATGWFTIAIVALAILAGYIAINPGNRGLNIGFLGYKNDLQLKQGLDLKGGIQFLLAVNCPSNKPNCTAADKAPLIAPTIQNITHRINSGLGVSEAVVTYQQDPTSRAYYISVELPGLKDDREAAALIGSTGNLEVINTGSTSIPLGTDVSSQICTLPTCPAGQYKVEFTGADLDPNAISAGFSPTNQPQIEFAFQGAAKDRFATYTQNNINQFLTITLDNKVIESATINQQITGNGVISGGSMTLQQAQDTANLLRYGALPLSLTPASERQIDPTLGAAAINQSLLAAEIGLGLVVLFMLFYYRLPGLLAALALALYAALVITAIKLLGAVLTLAGIAGLILSIGMAVDANVLIFERIKEELRAGRTLSAAIDIGWKRAWPSIRDSNASTIITCLILSFFGNNFGATIIVGFATNLLLGVLVSLFTAVVVTRTLLNDLVRFVPGVVHQPWLFGLPKDAISVPSYRRPTRAETPRPQVALAGRTGSSNDDDGEV